ncbi:hypothetical protein [Thermus brockianus]|uniref:hypothetical protein n=1 Tax=Thermus brockianus TaxID=56956 RepID=UPI000A4835F6|nr:hypothetical protein [Thermus brockianus]
MTPVEESPETFFARFQAYAVRAYLFPEPWGSPLLEALVEGTIVYAFDRGTPPPPRGPPGSSSTGWWRRPSPWRKPPL